MGIEDIIRKLENLEKEINSFPQLSPKIPEAEQDKIVPVNSPQVATKEDKKMRYAQDVPIDSNKTIAKEYTPEEEISIGMKEELEHKDVTGGDLEKTRKIVDAHLKEDHHYYSKLKKVGLIGKGMDTTGNGYAEGAPAHDNYWDKVTSGNNRLNETQKPIESKAVFSPDAGKQEIDEENDPIVGEEQHPIVYKLFDTDIVKSNLIPVLTIVHYKSGRVQTSIRWRNPESIGVKDVNANKELVGVIHVEEGPYFTHYSKVKQTLFYLADSIDMDRLYNDDFIPTDDHPELGEGLYLYNDLERAKKKNEEDHKTILPVKINVQNPYVKTEDNWDENLKNNLDNLGYDSIAIPSGVTQVYDIFVLSSKDVRVLGTENA